MDKRFYDSLKRIRREKATNWGVQLMWIKPSIKTIRYTQDDFEASFRSHFTIDDQEPVADSGRILYLMTSTEL